MTWHNTPCAPTLAAFSNACPHGWAEIRFTYYGGNPTADPPQDADCSNDVGRLWGDRERRRAPEGAVQPRGQSLRQLWTKAHTEWLIKAGARLRVLVTLRDAKTGKAFNLTNYTAGCQ